MSVKEDDIPPLLPMRPLPCLAKACPQTTAARRPLSNASLDSTIRKDVLQLYGSEELPSIYLNTVFKRPFDKTDPSFVEGNIDEDRPKKITQIIDSDHDLDLEKLLNLPIWKKSLNVICIFLMCIISPFTSSVFAPAIPDLMLEFETTDPYLSSFVVSIYVLGYAIGPLLVSPLSELVGRVPLYHICNTLFSVSTLLCGTTTSLGGMAAARLFAGMGGSSIFALAPSSIADMFPREKHGAVMALIAVAYNLGPSVSPTAGSYLNAAWGWSWIFYTSGGIDVMITVLNFAGLGELCVPVLLRRKAARMRRRSRIIGRGHLE